MGIMLKTIRIVLLPALLVWICLAAIVSIARAFDQPVPIEAKSQAAVRSLEAELSDAALGPASCRT